MIEKCIESYNRIVERDLQGRKYIHMNKYNDLKTNFATDFQNEMKVKNFCGFLYGKLQKYISIIALRLP